MEYIFLLIFGICITILGIFNLKGNISTIHWYNRLKITKENSKGRKSYKIFASDIELKHYLSKNQDKLCKYNRAVFSMNKYKEFNNTKIKYLTKDEVEKYLSEM